jgi:hypothetical protein
LETLAPVEAERSAIERAATLAGAAAAIRDTIASRAALFDVAITGPHLDRIKASVSEQPWHRARYQVPP